MVAAQIGPEISYPIHAAYVCAQTALEMERGASEGSVNVSTATLLRGAELLDNVARCGVVKEELPEDEAEIISKMEAST